MIDPPIIVESIHRNTAVVRMTIPRTEIRTLMGPAMADVMTAVKAQSCGPAGPMFTRHFRMDPKVFDFEVGVPVERPLAQAGRVVPSELPACRVARTVYRGPYEDLAVAWAEFDRWMGSEGYTPAPAGLWESYLSGPGASEPETELNRPLLG